MNEAYRSRQYTYEQPLLLWLIPALMLLLVALFVFGGDVGESWMFLAVTEFILLAVLFLPVSIVVTSELIDVHVLWIPSRRVPLAEVMSVEVRQYHPLRQFGGWGWRVGRSGARAYTVSGTTAAVVTLRDGREVYLGARDPAALAEAIRTRLS